MDQDPKYAKFRAASEADHKAIMHIAKMSPYTRDFSNQVMFSSPAAYEKGWIRVVYLPSEYSEDLILGFTCVRHKKTKPETVLYFVGVSEAVRSWGYGHLLLEDLMQHSPHRLLALNVMKANEGAIRFYQREGFRIAGEAMNGEAWHLEKEYPPL